MNDLVFLEPNRLDAEPFTTSKVVAEMTHMNHRRVKDAIRKHETAFLDFGLLGAYETESSGGRPEEIVKLNEQQAADGGAGRELRKGGQHGTGANDNPPPG